MKMLQLTLVQLLQIQNQELKNERNQKLKQRKKPNEKLVQALSIQRICHLTNNYFLQADLQEREDRKKKQEAEEAERKAKEDQEKRQEQERLAQEKRIEEEKAKQELLEYTRLKQSFGIEEEGYEETLENEGSTLTQFIEHIKVRIHHY